MNRQVARNTPLDIRAESQRISAALVAGRYEPAFTQLQQRIDTEPQVVSEALLRYIAADQSGALDRIARFSRVAGMPEGSSTLIDALLHSKGPPRFFTAQEVGALTHNQQYDVYASIVATRGSADAIADLASGNRVLLGMRQENHTAINRGQGIYDDRIVVLWNDASGRGVAPFHDANTEPSAQYDAHAARGASPFENVRHRGRSDGLDVNGDGVQDLGRLAEGTYIFAAAIHEFPGQPKSRHFALRPTPASVAASPEGVQRDTNGDGWFDSADINGVQPLNATFKHHRGEMPIPDRQGVKPFPHRWKESKATIPPMRKQYEVIRRSVK